MEGALTSHTKSAWVLLGDFTSLHGMGCSQWVIASAVRVVAVKLDSVRVWL